MELWNRRPIVALDATDRMCDSTVECNSQLVVVLHRAERFGKPVFVVVDNMVHVFAERESRVVQEFTGVGNVCGQVGKLPEVEKRRYPELCVWVGFMSYRFSVAQGGEINRSPYFSAN